ncbi:hypothetical protein F4820DRAFT_147300 [Hypoxylon rubiginosum]|uniref:Uncharacterized protein n=1 Tax=Hypoxylon rubiginosum TaxID=110542 RepID=A0ACB9ZJS2_9PEZI|nr:hypothetical protein F4820DRAFT_147300 [Hypoxylon rubiginosum]
MRWPVMAVVAAEVASADEVTAVVAVTEVAVIALAQAVLTPCPSPTTEDGDSFLRQPLTTHSVVGNPVAFLCIFLFFVAHMHRWRCV